MPTPLLHFLLPMHAISYPFLLLFLLAFENQVKEDRIPLPGLAYLFCPPFRIFPSHVSLTCLTLEQSQAEEHQHTVPGPNLPLSLSLPVYVSLPEATTEASPYHHPSSAHPLYLSAGTLPSIHSSPRLVREQDGRKEEKRKKYNASQKIRRK